MKTIFILTTPIRVELCVLIKPLKRKRQAILNNSPDYVGSYYHLGKLFERNDNQEKAIEWYEKGMEIAKEKGEQHAFGELKGAWEELTF